MVGARFYLWLLIFCFLTLSGCGGGGGGATAGGTDGTKSTPTPTANVVVSVSPPSASVTAEDTTKFTAVVTGTSDTAVTWNVIETGGGSITASGLYTAPTTTGTYHVKATSVADSAQSATATVTVVSGNLHSIYGNITVSGKPLPGVTVSCSSGSATTDTTSNYTIKNLRDGTYTVTPTLAGYTFTPSSYTVTISGKDAAAIFEAAGAIPIKYGIYGKISVGGEPLADAAVNWSGGPATTGGTATTDANGNYLINNLYDSKYTGSYTLSPAKSGYTFTPATVVVTISSASVFGQNFTATGTSATPYSISGNITAGGSPVAGVTVSCSGGSATTDASGNYSISNLANGSYTISPTKTGYTFTPATLAATVNGANVAGKNFTATFTSATPFSISGNISAGGTPLAGVTVSCSGGSATTDASGNYSISTLANGSYTLSPTKTGYAFTPATLAVTVNSSSVNGKNFTASNTGSITVNW